MRNADFLSFTHGTWAPLDMIGITLRRYCAIEDLILITILVAHSSNHFWLWGEEGVGGFSYGPLKYKVDGSVPATSRSSCTGQ